jgi:hypothetical protein
VDRAASRWLIGFYRHEGGEFSEAIVSQKGMTLNGHTTAGG